MPTWTITYPLPADRDDVLPAGASTATRALTTTATYISDPTAYVLVGFTGRDPRTDETTNTLLEKVRREVAEQAQVKITDTVPKLALVSRALTADADLWFQTRMFAPHAVGPRQPHGACWHSGVATGGVLALALALADPRTLPGGLLGERRKPVVVIDTPAGRRVLEYVDGPDGQPAVRVDIGTVTIEGPASHDR